MRHGTTVWNEKKISQGRAQNRLSKKGKLECEKVSLLYKKVCFDLILASPRMRTMQTANIINKYHNVTIKKDNRLIEVDQGVITGKCFDDLTDQEKLALKQRNKEFNMESWQQLYDRIFDFVKDLKMLKNINNLLIVTHGSVIAYLNQILQGKSFEEISSIKIADNAKIINIKYQI